MRIVVGISGASGAPIAVDLLKQLHRLGVETHLVITSNGERTLMHECGLCAEALVPYCQALYPPDDVGALPASGSWMSDGMIIVPASMKTIAGIAGGYSSNLLLRAADVMLKERRRLIVVARECPLSAIHLKNMSEITAAGAVILPAIMTFYNKPLTIDDMTRHLVGKILDHFGLTASEYRRWGD